MSHPEPRPYPYSDSSPGLALGSGIAMALCCNPLCGVVAVVFAAIAMTRLRDDESKDRFLRNSWLSMGVGVLTTSSVVLYLYGLR